jgi:phage-related protein
MPANSIQSMIDVVAPTVEMILDPVTALVQSRFDAIALFVQVILDAITSAVQTICRFGFAFRARFVG